MSLTSFLEPWNTLNVCAAVKGHYNINISTRTKQRIDREIVVHTGIIQINVLSLRESLGFWSWVWQFVDWVWETCWRERVDQGHAIQILDSESATHYG
jgi:hypothetical protein